MGETQQEKRREKYPCIMRCRISEEQRERLHEAAAIAGMRPGTYARHRIAGSHVSSKMDLQVLNEIRRQGGLLKKLAMDGHDTSAALNEIIKTMRVLQVRINKE